MGQQTIDGSAVGVVRGTGLRLLMQPKDSPFFPIYTPFDGTSSRQPPPDECHLYQGA